MAVDPAKAVAAGLTFRELSESVDDVIGLVGRPRGPLVVAHARARGHARTHERLSPERSTKICSIGGKFQDLIGQKRLMGSPRR